MWALGNATVRVYCRHTHNVYPLIISQGLIGTVVTRKGDTFTGVFAGAMTEVNDSTFLFKMVRQLSEQFKETTNGTRDCSGDYVGIGSDHSMTFNAGDIADIIIENVSTTTTSGPQNGKPFLHPSNNIQNHS